MSSTVPKGDFINETHQRDLEHSKVLHGNGSKLSNASFLSKLVSKNSAAHRKELSNYLSFWDSNAAKSGIEEAGLADTRQKKYTEVVNCYYNLITDSCELAWGQSIHFARKFKGEGFKQSVARHEHYLAALGQFKPGMKILDVGSGVGGPAREIARFIGCHITGINNNDYQIARATAYSKQTGTTPQTAFVKGDFMQMPFSDDSFDGAYAIEATCYAPSLAGVYGEIFRVIKPGSTFVAYEMCTTDKYDPKNLEHRHMIHAMEKGMGVPKLPTTAECLRALREVGFEVEFAQDLAVSHISGDEKWYASVSPGMFSNIMGFARSRVGHPITIIILRMLELVRLAPSGLSKVVKLLNQTGAATNEAGAAEVFTPMYTILARKPQCT